MNVLITGSGVAATRIIRCIKKSRPHSIISRWTSNPFNADLPFLHPTADIKLGEYDAFFLCGASVERKTLLEWLLAMNKPIFCEKPIISPFEGSIEIKSLQSRKYSGSLVAVGYCLHYVNGINRFIRDITSNNCRALSAACRSDVLKWPNRNNPSRSISHSLPLGGGVVAELSHEIDILHSIINNIVWTSVKAVGLKHSEKVPGEVYAVGSGILGSRIVPVELTLSLNHVGKTERMVTCLTEDKVLLKSQLSTDPVEDQYAYTERDIEDSYQRQINDFFRNASTPEHYRGRRLDHMFNLQDSINYLHTRALKCLH